jgi:hypothetical protein
MEEKIYVSKKEVLNIDGKEVVRFPLPEIFKLNSDLYMNTAIANAVFNTKENQYDSKVMSDFLQSRASKLLKIEKTLLY